MVVGNANASIIIHPNVDNSMVINDKQYASIPVHLKPSN